MKTGPLYILFDMDDTLIDTKSVYDVVRKNAYNYLEKTFGPLSQSYSDFRHASIAYRNSYKKQKLSSEEVASKSIINAAELCTQSALTDTQIETLHAISQEAFTMVPPLKQGIEDALESFTRKMRLYKKPIHLIVFTQGHQDWQTEKFLSLPSHIQDKFERVIVVPRKNTETYQAFLNANKIKADDVIMIGDKATADINPALHAGMHAYHIPLRDHLDFPSVSQLNIRKKTGKYQRFKDMSQCLKFIRHHFLEARPRAKLRHRL